MSAGNGSMMSFPNTMPTENLERPQTPTNTVPPPDLQRRTKETPSVGRSVHSSSYWDGTLAEKRLTLLEELGYAIPEVPVGTFIRTLPPLKPGINIDSIISSWKIWAVQNGRWVKFSEEPKACKRKNETFQPQDIFNKAVETVVRQRTGFDLRPGFDQMSVVGLRLMPGNAPESARSGKTRPDGCILLKDVDTRNRESETAVYRWYDIALTWGFKLKDTDEKRDENVTQMIYGMQHTMTLDPCKRFTFGITIENANLRLWFCSRAVMVVSEPFNFITQPDLLSRVFLSLAFASKPELGWDLSIRVVDPNGVKRIYQIEVNGKWYEVIDVLSDFGADAIIGRATRVFRVKDLISSKEHVLKDVWVEDDRELEHIINQMILEDVERKFRDENIKKLVSSHLLTPVNNWLVEVDGQEDHTKDIMMRGHDISLDNIFKLVVSAPSVNESSKSMSHMKSMDKEVHDELNEHFGTRVTPETPRSVPRHRRHYQVVFDEVALHIRAVTKLGESFRVLTDCATALKYIHISGWIHRDISAGNIYLFNTRGLIGDLEHAKKTTTHGTHDMRTGTPDFMAVEVMSNGYVFLPPRYSGDANAERAKAIRLGRKPENITPQRGEQPPFVQNEAHDIESLWWISLYKLFFNGDSSLAGEETKQQRHGRKVWTQRIFPSTVTNKREDFLRNEKVFKDGIEWFPRSFFELKEPLDVFRDCLVQCYQDFGNGFPNITWKYFASLHDSAIDVFEGCVRVASNIEILSHEVPGRIRQQVLLKPTPPGGGPIRHDDSQQLSRRRSMKNAPARPAKRLKLAKVKRQT